MSFLCGGGPGGCGLCGTERTSTKSLTSEEFQNILPILSAATLISEITANNNPFVIIDWTAVNYSDVVFCSGCRSLLRDMKSLQDQDPMNTTTATSSSSSVLDAIVSKVRAKLSQRRPVLVKSEVIIIPEDEG